MPDVVKECPVCKMAIEVDNINNIHGIARVRSKYYHTKCLKEYAQKLAKRERHDAIWDDVINNIAFYEKEAKEIMYKRYWQDKLNDHLKKHYNIVVMPERFWEMIMKLHDGIYKNKECKPISMDIIYGAWRWSQKNLDSINRKNKQNRKGPKTDIERLPYDLTIIIQHIPDYIKAKSKHEVEEAARKAREKERVRINYNDIYVAPAQQEGLDDISDILDEI